MENERVAPAASAFGSLLRRYRLAAGLSQEALAERARISPQGIGALERGDRRTPQRETLTLLTKALALSAEQRRGFEAAAVRQSVPRPGRPAVTTGPWPAAPAAILPLSLTTFVGREGEVQELRALLREHRLVTLTGPGGIGKTQTALEVAPGFGDVAGDTCLVELAPLVDPGLVAASIASALGLQEVPSRPLLETILAHLQHTAMLLVLDNCEHVIDEAARIVENLLHRSPLLRVLATSREPLRVTGERVYRLPPLAVPSLDRSAVLDAAEAARYPAIQLFAQCAQAADHRFALSDENAAVVAGICVQLEGIPLAIELAAARVTTLSLAVLAEKLERRFALLARGARSAHPRQQTMRAAIDWSYELLAEPERRFFECFSVFAGGCTLEAAVTVAPGDAGELADHFELLTSLVEKSLIVADMDGSAPRYRMLETFRHYAREKLVMRGELDAVCARHAAAYLKIAEEIECAFRELPDREWHEPARPELDNWRAALEWTLGAGRDVWLGQRLAATLRPIWGLFILVEGRRWIRLAIERVDERTDPSVAAKLDTVDAFLSEQAGEFSAALAAAERAVDRYRALGDRTGTARAQVNAGNALVRLGRPAEAEPLLHEALNDARANGRKALAGNILNIMSEARALCGDFAGARAASDRALTEYRTLGKEHSLLVTLTTRADLEFRAGDAEAAVRIAQEALGGLDALTFGKALESALHANLSAYLVSLARYDEARIHARQALDVAQRLDAVLHEAWALQHLAAIAVLAPQMSPKPTDVLSRAARLIGFVDARYVALGSALEPTDRQEYDRILAALRAALPDDILASLLRGGAGMSEVEAIGEALKV